VLAQFILMSAVAQWLERRTVNQENPGLNIARPCRVRKFAHSALLLFSKM